MTRPLFFIATAILFAACQPSNYREKEKVTKSIVATADTTNKFQYPDTILAKQILLDYFERHKGEDVFDTIDNSNFDNFRLSASTVEAGHLFSAKAIHAVLYLSTEQTSTILIYRKLKENWIQIFADTIDVTQSSPEYKDWNNDSIKDLYLFYMSPIGSMSVIDRGDVWLVDKSLNKIRAIPEFEDLDNPEVDSLTGVITSAYYHHGQHIRTYKFKRTKLLQLSEKHITEE